MTACRKTNLQQTYNVLATKTCRGPNFRLGKYLLDQMHLVTVTAKVLYPITIARNIDPTLQSTIWLTILGHLSPHPTRCGSVKSSVRFLKDRRAYKRISTFGTVAKRYEYPAYCVLLCTGSGPLDQRRIGSNYRTGARRSWRITSLFAEVTCSYTVAELRCRRLTA